MKLKRLTAAVLLAGMLLAQPALGDITVSEFHMSNNPGEDLTLIVNEKTIVLENIPDDNNFKYLMFSLIDESGNVYLQEVVERKQALSYTANYDISSIPDGTYYFQMYTADQEFTTYWAYIWNQEIQLEISGGKISFVLSPVYEKNLQIYNSRRTDQAALTHYLMPEAKIQSDSPEIQQLSALLVQGLTDDYAKLVAIHDWVAENIYYDYDAFYSGGVSGDGSALGTLSSRRGVCEGYASLTAALLRAANIPTKIVNGYALGIGEPQSWSQEIIISHQTNHAWNEAWVNGRWVILDVTWDSDNSYLNGGYTKEGTGETRHKYFDINLEAFSNDHKIEDYAENF